jgi:hypothetical protein
MKKILYKTVNNILGRVGLKLIKSTVSTARPGLDDFTYNGADREWAQMCMYVHVINEILEVPGDIAEFGVAGGTSIRSFARLTNVLDKYKNNHIAKKQIYGFDTFDGLPFFDEELDTGIKNAEDMQRGGYNGSEEFNNLNYFCRSRDNIELIKGTFSDTLEPFLHRFKHTTFSLIHIDCDLHQSTMDALDPMLSRLNVGGIILFDEIFHKDFPGETTGFLESYSRIKQINEKYQLEFIRVKSMPWKWYAKRTM